MVVHRYIPGSLDWKTLVQILFRVGNIRLRSDNTRRTRENAGINGGIDSTEHYVSSVALHRRPQLESAGAESVGLMSLPGSEIMAATTLTDSSKRPK